MNVSPLILALVFAGTLVPASAQITVDNTLNGTLVFGDPGPAGEQVVASFDASNSDKLVVVISTEHAFGITAGFSIDGAEYNGRAMIEAVEENTLPGATALYYLDDPGPAGEIRVFMGMKNGGLVTIYAVSGTENGVAATGRSTTDTVAVTTTSANSLVIAGILDGGQAANGNGPGAPVSNPPLIQVHSNVWGANIWGGHGSGYQIVAAPGAVNSSFTTAGPVRLRTVAAAFEPGGSIGTNYCTAAANSTGGVGMMTASGSTSAAANNLTLGASGLPSNQFGIFATSMNQGFTPGAGGTSNGNLCLGGAVGRFTLPSQIVSSGPTGELSLTIDTTQIPQGAGFVTIIAGQTWNFQAWHRDQVGLGSNFTDGIEVMFN